MKTLFVGIFIGLSLLTTHGASPFWVQPFKVAGDSAATNLQNRITNLQGQLNAKLNSSGDLIANGTAVRITSTNALLTGDYLNLTHDGINGNVQTATYGTHATPLFFKSNGKTGLAIATNGVATMAFGFHAPAASYVEGGNFWVTSSATPLTGAGVLIRHDGTTGIIESSYFSTAYAPMSLRTSGLERVGIATAGLVTISAGMTASGNVTTTNGFSSYSVNVGMAVSATGATNSTTVNQIAWLTAATGLQLYDNAGTAIWSGTQSITTITPILVQPNGKFTGTLITSVGSHAF